jgi:4-hydroxy-tetrahydrodipicolinate synthase
MIYDIPHRSGIPIATETLVRVAEHPNIVAVKDAKGDLAGTSDVLRRTRLAYYSGDDASTLPWLSIGAVGLVGTSTHFTGPLAKDMILAYEAGDVARALELHRKALPLFTGIFRAPGTVLVKAGLRALGLPCGPVRLPLVDATAEELDQLRKDAAAAGIVL